MDCLFCQIVAGTLPGGVVYEEAPVVPCHHLCPQAPVHVVVMPKNHIATLNDLSQDDKALAGHILHTAQRLASELGCTEGFRVVMNCNPLGGQTVYHIHMHVLGQRQMHWPPG